MILMSDALAQIDQIAQSAREELRAVRNAVGLEQYRIKFLGSKGLIKGMMKLIGTAPKEKKPVIGQRVNQANGEIESAFNEVKQNLSQDPSGDRDYVDVTEPGLRPKIGNRHILMKVVDELTELFGRMGFSVATGPEVEDDFHNFVALNIPESHPARDPLDNFYLQTDSAPGTQRSALLLRTQTSTVQIRVME